MGTKIGDRLLFQLARDVWITPTDLRSMTQRRATYSMEFDHYEEVPANVAKEIIEKRSNSSLSTTPPPSLSI